MRPGMALISRSSGENVATRPQVVLKYRPTLHSAFAHKDEFRISLAGQHLF